MYQITWKYFSPDTFRAAFNQMRTASLWGVRLRNRLMHDGASVTPRDAILRHSGEARDVSHRFERLSHSDQEAILDFLGSL